VKDTCPDPDNVAKRVAMNKRASEFGQGRGLPEIESQRKALFRCKTLARRKTMTLKATSPIAPSTRVDGSGTLEVATSETESSPTYASTVVA